VDGLLRRPQGVPGQTEAMLAQFRSPHYREVARAFVGTFFPVADTEALRDEVTAEMLLTPQNVMAGAMTALLDTNQPDWNLPPVAVPVLVFNARSSQWLAGYENYVRTLSPQAEFRMFENVGHCLMLEQPAEFNAALIELLRKYDLMAK
jgi:pimeloyl-ACP methyl ester carboxylesterase